MQALVWILRLIVLLAIVWFATKNVDPVTIHGVLDQKWQAPLVFVMLVAFVAGIVIGLLAWVPTVVRQRREIGRLKKTAVQLAAIRVERKIFEDVPHARIPLVHRIGSTIVTQAWQRKNGGNPKGKLRRAKGHARRPLTLGQGAS